MARVFCNARANGAGQETMSGLPAAEASRPVLIGWKEFLDLPDLGLFRLKCKVDTGARTSTLHCDALTLLEELSDGTALAEIAVSPDRRSPGLRVTSLVKVLRRIAVTDSGGHPELRPLIETVLVLGPVRRRILLTLADRRGMLFRMILGRKAVEGSFQIDPAKKYLLRRWHRRGALSGSETSPPETSPG
jgi:hypothetical protein